MSRGNHIDESFERRSFNDRHVPRPQSAKPNDKSPQKPRIMASSNSKKRPRAAKGQTLLAKLKPRNILIDKERLYEQNMALKLQNNQLKDQVLKLRTKLNSQQRELNKREQTDQKGGRNSHLIASLKNSVKDLKHQIQTKQDQLFKVKRQIKHTKYGELQIEIQAYIDQCTRLRHHLEELMRQRDAPTNELGYTSLQERQQQLNQLVSQLQQENNELKEGMNKHKAQASRWKQRFLNLEKKKKPSARKTPEGKVDARLRAKLEAKNKDLSLKEKSFQQEAAKFNQELRNKQNQLAEAERKEQDYKKTIQGLQKQIQRQNTPQIRSRNPPILFQTINQYLQKTNISLKDFLIKLDQSKTGYIQNPTLQKRLKKYIKFEKSSLDQIFMLILGKSQGKISFATIGEFYSGYQFPQISPISAQIQEILLHFSMRMQLHRISRMKLLQTLFGFSDPSKALTEEALKKIFSKQPLNLKPPDLNQLTYFLIPSGQSTIQQVGDKLLQHLEQWEIFNSSDQEDFDKQLSLIISKNKETLIKACQSLDTIQKGEISLTQFKQALSFINLDFPPTLFKYISLLFYSHSYTLDSVPYLNFIKAYSEQGLPQADQDLDDQQRAKVVRYYLDIIAKKLNQNDYKVRDVFKSDNKGFIFPQEFVNGLKILQVEVQEEVLVLMLEALQFEEDQSNVCVFIEELEEILQHYGVPVKSEHNKKVSLLEYDDESEESDQDRGSDDEEYDSEFEESLGRRSF